jgi:hypothetical protein
MLLAYKYVAAAVLVAEANFNAERLELPIEKPILLSKLAWTYIPPVSTLKDDGFGGRIDAGHYAFSEGGRPGYRYITKLEPFGGLSTAEQNQMLSHCKSLIGTNGAYRLASNWLSLIDVDVHELEKTNKAEVQQRWFWGGGSPERRVLLPIFEVGWGGSKTTVTVDGRTKQVIEIRQEDDSFSRRPRELVKGLDKLLAVSDEEFLKYSTAERSNLVVRFAATNYPVLDVGEHSVSDQKSR